MNYKAIYRKLCESPVTTGYTEKHHIVPRCMGGTDDIDNLVDLSAKGHYLAHRLLTKIHPNNTKLLFAFSMMGMAKNRRKLTGYQYEQLNKAKSLAMQLDNPMKRKGVKYLHENLGDTYGDNNVMRQRPDLRKKASDRMKTADNPMTRFPERNHTAKPIRVTYLDGLVEEYSYGAELSKVKGVPYSTIKLIIRHKRGSKKWNIESIIQLGESS